MSNKSITRILILGALAIIGILGMQVYWMLRSLELRKQEFQENAKIALIQVARNLAKARNAELPSYTTVQQRGSSSFIININDIIDAGQLEYSLSKEFLFKGIKLDFDYAIYDCNNKEVVFGNRVELSTLSPQHLKIRKLPQYNKFLYYFGVRFHSTDNYILSGIWLPLLFTGVLLFILIIFTINMVVILRQKRLSEIQKDFINNMTHEFKTPISTIRISADMFINNDLIKSDKRLIRYAQIIKEQNKRLNDQVEKVLQVAKLDKGKVSMETSDVNLNSIIVSVVDSFEPFLSEINGHFELHLNASNAKIKADSLHLVNILNSLLDNAVKYRRIDPLIKISSKDIDNSILLSIEDNGIGIEKKNLKNIFKKFYRVPTGNVHNVKGFGLGLFYVNSICKAHGWQLGVDSIPGEGTTFTIKFKKNT